MRWTIAFSILIVAVFTLLYRVTADIWAATNAAGIIAVVFLVGAAIRFTRIFEIRWQRMIASSLAVIMIVALVARWIFMWQMTEWQFAQLQTIRRTIYSGMAMSMLKTPAYETLREFRGTPVQTTLGEVFRRLNPGGTPVIDSVITADTGPVYTIVSDTVVQLTTEARFVAGFDTSFVNVDGRHGLAQIQARLTREGVSYDIQN